MSFAALIPALGTMFTSVGATAVAGTAAATAGAGIFSGGGMSLLGTILSGAAKGFFAGSEEKERGEREKAAEDRAVARNEGTHRGLVFDTTSKTSDGTETWDRSEVVGSEVGQVGAKYRNAQPPKTPPRYRFNKDTGQIEYQ